MEPRLQRIIAYIVVIVVLVGIGFLVYRFIQSPKSTNVKTLVINQDGKFTTDELKVGNDEVIKVKNEDDKNHTVKKSESNETFVEVDARSTSRELTLEDNTSTSLYLADDENEKTAIVTGTPKTDEEEPTSPEATEAPNGQTAGATDQNNLPDTGPEGLYLFPIFAGLGIILVKLSNRLLKN
jgi:hypothetical protein